AADLEPPHQPLALLRADAQRELQALALARHPQVVGQRRVHRFDELIDVMHADAGLVAKARRQFFFGRLIDVAEFDHDAGVVEKNYEAAGAAAPPAAWARV